MYVGDVGEYEGEVGWYDGLGGGSPRGL